MAREIEPVSFDEFLSRADTIFAQIEQEGKSFLVEYDGILFSVGLKRPKARKRSRAITSQDSLLNIIGIGTSQGPTDISVNKHAYKVSCLT